MINGYIDEFGGDPYSGMFGPAREDERLEGTSAPHQRTPDNGAQERILARTLDSIRVCVSGPALAGLCTFVIHHAIETLRRAGRSDEARTILVSELGDLDLARTSGPALDRTLETEVRGLRLIQGGRRHG